MVDTRVPLLMTLGLLVGVATAIASERSELLTAKGQLAYGRGEYVEAKRLLEQAVVADPNDASAHEALGQVLAALGRRDEATAAFQRALAIDPYLPGARAGLAAVGGEVTSALSERPGGTVGELGRLAPVRGAWDTSRWGFSVTTGFQWDSNVTVAPDGLVGGGGGTQSVSQGKESAGGWVAAVGTEFDLIERPDFLLRFEYDFYQTLHFTEHDFDFRAQQPRATASYGLTPALWLGVEGGYNYYTLGDDTYQGEPYVMPFTSYLEGDWGLTQVIYRWGDETFFSTPFNDVRDGPAVTLNASQTFYFAHERYVTAGYQWARENPTQSGHSYTGFATNRNGGFVTIGNDWQYSSNQGYLGFGSPVVLGVYADLLYLFRSDNYRWPNSYANFDKKRQDDGHYIYLGLTRPIMDHVALAVTYYGTLNDSNIGIFEYNRNVVATLLQVTY
jgi:hypothetical protein